MNDRLYTQEGERPDLAAMEVAAPEGFIAHEILPIVPVVDKTGIIYYATATADVAAQTGRAVGAAPTATQISDSSTTYTCAEAIKRGRITPDEAKQMGGIEKADAVGAKFAKRSVMRARETDCAGLILATGAAADNAFDPAKIQTDVQDAIDTFELYDGVTALIASTWVFKAMLQEMLLDSTYGPALARLVSGASGVQAVQGLSLEAWKQAVAIFFGVDKVLAGNSGIWNATAINGRFAIAKLDDDPDPMSHKWKPVLGKTYQFLPDGTNPWFIESIPHRNTKNNFYDATGWYDAVLLNSAAVYVFDGVAG